MSNLNGAGMTKPATELKKITSTRVVYYEIAHRVPGRLRLCIPRLAVDPPFARRVLEAVQALPTLVQTRVSPRSSSLIVVYRPSTGQGTSEARLMDDEGAVLRAVVGRVRAAAGAEVAQEMQRAVADARPRTDIARRVSSGPGVTGAPVVRGRAEARAAIAAARGQEGGFDKSYYFRRLFPPALGIGLSASVAAGLALPGWLVGGAILASTYPIVKRSVHGLRTYKRPTTDFLDAVSLPLLVAQGVFLAPAVVVGIIEGAEVVRDWTARRHREVNVALLLNEERTVRVHRDDIEMWLAWEQIEVGDVVEAYPGDQIPVDGTVLSGWALVDEHQLSGDSSPLARAEGETVHASTLVIEGHLRILATQTGSETLAAQILALVESAPNVDTRISNFAHSTGNWAVIPTLAASGAVLAASGSIARATGIVSMDLGTGMRVSAPIAIITAQTNAAQHGVLIRSGRAIEKLAEVNTIVFDKTGTLTEGRVRVVDVRPLAADVEPWVVLQVASSAEQALNHPLARAIARHAQEQDIEPLTCGAWSYVVGQGVVATIDGQPVLVGSRRLLEEAGIRVSESGAGSEDEAHEAAMEIYVARGGQLIGEILCTDPLRPESAEIVAQLRRMNLATHMLSGDGERVAQETGEILEIPRRHIHAEVLPQQKVERIQEFQAVGRRVAFVGDGINDAAAMAHADVSIALASAADLVRETADIVLLNNDLRDIVTAIEISRHAMQIIAQNQVLVVSPNVATIVYGVAAVLNPLVGVVVNNGLAMVAGLNSLRPLDAPVRAARGNEVFEDDSISQSSEAVIEP